MSDMSDILALGLAVFVDINGDALGYRVGTSGSFTALPGFTINHDRIGEPQYDDDDRVMAQRETATVKGPLAPVLVKGYQVQDSGGSTWAIESVKSDQQQVCTLWREVVAEHGPDRKDNA